MAYFEQRKGGWMVQIRRKGMPTLSRTFDRKADGEQWARAVELEVQKGNIAALDDSAQRIAFREVIERFRASMLASYKPSNRAPIDSRLKAIEAKWGALFLASIRPVDLAKWRDDMQQDGLSSQSVKHYLNLVSRLLRFAEQELGVHLPSGNAARSVRKPAAGQARDRRLRPGEYEALHADRPDLLAFILLAVETSMRRSEICNLRWDDVDLHRRIAHVRESKNGESRTVALSSVAVNALQSLSRRLGGHLWGWKTAEGFSSAWKRHIRQARKAHVLDRLRQALAGEGMSAENIESEIRAVIYKHRKPAPRTAALLADIEQNDPFLTNLRFHDLRHEATSRLFEKGLGVMEVASMTGHKSLSMLKRYTHVEAEKLAKKLG